MISISEAPESAGPVYTGYLAGDLAAGAGASTVPPVLPGRQPVSASVTVRYALTQ